MAGRTPEEAQDAFLDQIRDTFACITTATVYAAREAAVNRENSLTLLERGSVAGRVRLSTHDGLGELVLRVAHEFTIRSLPGNKERASYEVSSSYYQYRILDFDENEILVYDWHPAGISSVRTPHLHISAALPITLMQRAGSQLAGRKTHLSKFHLPTARIFVEDIVGLLIQEFKADPLRANWSRILADNRAAIELDRSW